MVYDSPVAYLENVFPYPPVPLHEIFEVHVKPQQPSHVLLFGSLLEKRDSEASTTHTVAKLCSLWIIKRCGTGGTGSTLRRMRLSVEGEFEYGHHRLMYSLA